MRSLTGNDAFYKNRIKREVKMAQKTEALFIYSYDHIKVMTETKQTAELPEV